VSGRRWLVVVLLPLILPPRTPTAMTQPPGLLFVSNELSHDVSVVNIATNTVIATIPVGGRARGIHLSPDGKRLYVAVSDDKPQLEGSADAIVAVDVASKKVIATYRIGSDPEQFAITPDGVRIYASNEDGGTATVIDLQKRKQIATLVVGIEPEGVAVSPDGRWVYVTSETSNSVSIIDAHANKVVANLLVDLRPRAAAFTPDRGGRRHGHGHRHKDTRYHHDDPDRSRRRKTGWRRRRAGRKARLCRERPDGYPLSDRREVVQDAGECASRKTAVGRGDHRRRPLRLYGKRIVERCVGDRYVDQPCCRDDQGRGPPVGRCRLVERGCRVEG
jgi:YVTN family beta-propeller protein